MEKNIEPCDGYDNNWLSKIAERFLDFPQTSQPIVDDYAHGIGYVQAPNVIAQNWDSKQPIGILRQQLFRQAHGFFAKNKKHVVLVIDVIMRFGPVARKKGKVSVLMHGHERFETFINPDLEVLPIIQPRALEAAIR
jgi:hypothetical protein